MLPLVLHVRTSIISLRIFTRATSTGAGWMLVRRLCCGSCSQNIIIELIHRALPHDHDPFQNYARSFHDGARCLSLVLCLCDVHFRYSLSLLFRLWQISTLLWIPVRRKSFGRTPAQAQS
ncbi:hypothetical protein MPTK1_2g04450 [Marchantia polymorpha subsp. ruderalis]|uniref:Uncharacterized protein n=1 Tax=Marchantia polymorpha TaxID=3197 RepID=A0A2R6X7Q6_MARPO|nr:hypothetical protein MARPO_0031s0100 [Marchantia polymorpha]BBN01083.1 hypothetical protein Mp_2g04450 [Marchantia polymorpha subsp. ruderalis]|eukprot:PTQ42132.1 hypothetical protein MARPO_0031s0100 [Marchantia polymorpha]